MLSALHLILVTATPITTNNRAIAPPQRYGLKTCGDTDPSYEKSMGGWRHVKDSGEYDDLLFIECLDGFMLWISPFVAALVTLFYGECQSTHAKLLVITASPADSHVSHTTPAAFLAYFLDDNVQHKASNYFGYALCLLGGGLWCAASITGAGSGLTEAFFAVIQFGVIGLGLMVVGTFGFHGLAAAEKELVSSQYFKDMVERCV